MINRYEKDPDEEELAEFEEGALKKRAKLNQKWGEILKLAPQVNKTLKIYAAQGIAFADSRMDKLKEEHSDFYAAVILIETFSSSDCVGNRWHKPCLEAKAIMYSGLKD